MHRVISHRRCAGFGHPYSVYQARMEGRDVYIAGINIGYVNNLRPLPCIVYVELIEREICDEPDAHFYAVLEAEEEIPDPVPEIKSKAVMKKRTIWDKFLEWLAEDD